MKRFLLSLALLHGLAVMAVGQQPGEQSPAVEQSPDEAAIRALDAAYVEAFNRRDAAALANFWSPEAVYLNRVTGEEVVGREAIAAQFAALFKEPADAKLSVDVESVRFLSPNVAVEHGTSKLLAAKGEPELTPYTAVFVKREGQWLLDRVTDEAAAESPPPSHYDQLKVLEWMVGRWADRSEFARFEAECNWTKNRNFLTRSFSIAVEGQIEMSGMQIIGWDPAKKTIRSWTFDSAGVFAEAVWTQKGGQWFIHNQGVLTDGRQASMVNVIKPVDDNSFTFQTIERTAGTEILPNIDEVLIVRQ